MNKILIAIVVVLAAGMLVLGWQKSKEAGVVKGVAEQIVPAETISINLAVEGLEGLPTTLEFKKNIMLLEALKELNKEHPALNLQTKDFGEMGVLVEQMGSQKNGTDGKYWQFFVNGVQPMVGADKYVLQNNDRVEWRFAESEF